MGTFLGLELCLLSAFRLKGQRFSLAFDREKTFLFLSWSTSFPTILPNLTDHGRVCVVYVMPRQGSWLLNYADNWWFYVFTWGCSEWRRVGYAKRESTNSLRLSYHLISPFITVQSLWLNWPAHFLGMLDELVSFCDGILKCSSSGRNKRAVWIPI